MLFLQVYVSATLAQAYLYERTFVGNAVDDDGILYLFFVSAPSSLTKSSRTSDPRDYIRILPAAVRKDKSFVMH